MLWSGWVQMDVNLLIKPKGDEHLLASKQFCQKRFICVKCGYLKLRPQSKGSGAQVRSSHCFSKPIFKHGDSEHTENPNEVILTNSFIIQRDLFLWIRTEVCIFINNPEYFRRSWNILCVSQRGRDCLFQKHGHSVQTARVANVTTRRDGMNSNKASTRQKPNLRKGIFEFSHGLFSLYVCPPITK